MIGGFLFVKEFVKNRILSVGRSQNHGWGGGLGRNVMVMICPPGWDRVNWSVKKNFWEGAMAPLAPTALFWAFSWFLGGLIQMWLSIFLALEPFNIYCDEGGLE